MGAGVEARVRAPSVLQKTPLHCEAVFRLSFGGGDLTGVMAELTGTSSPLLRELAPAPGGKGGTEMASQLAVSYQGQKTRTTPLPI